MTASKEKLIEKIEKLKTSIDDIEERGEDPISVQKELDRLIQELNLKNNQLNLLKG